MKLQGGKFRPKPIGLTQQVLVPNGRRTLVSRTSSTRQSQVGGLPGAPHRWKKREMGALDPDDLNIWVKYVLEKETCTSARFPGEGKVEYVCTTNFGQSYMPSMAPNVLFLAGILGSLMMGMRVGFCGFPPHLHHSLGLCVETRRPHLMSVVVPP